jgi:hypothetical protein
VIYFSINFNYESQSVGQKNVQGLPDCQERQPGLCYLQEKPKAQAAARVKLKASPLPPRLLRGEDESSKTNVK